MNALFKYAQLKSNNKTGNDVGELAAAVQQATAPVKPEIEDGLAGAPTDGYLDATLGQLASDETSQEVSKLADDIKALNNPDAIKFFGQPIDEAVYAGLITSPEMRDQVNQSMAKVTDVLESEAVRPVKSIIKRKLLGLLR